MSADNGLPAGTFRVARGAHRNPADGTCLMELASVLAGEKFSDHPQCVHPAMAQLARVVNDRVSDETRQQLVHLLPQMMYGPRTDARAGLVIAMRCVDAATSTTSQRRLNRHRDRLMRDLERVSGLREVGRLRARRYGRVADRALAASLDSLRFVGGDVLAGLLTECTHVYAALGAAPALHDDLPAGEMAGASST